jgi:predicted metalloenzyme YecM
MDKPEGRGQVESHNDINGRLISRGQVESHNDINGRIISMFMLEKQDERACTGLI